MKNEPIAVVGAACRFPGASNLAHFWDLLIAGRDAVTEIPDGRWSKSYFFHAHPPTRGKSYSWAAGVVDNIETFDPAFFGISPREAEQIDPQQRLALELTWEAIEDAGLLASRLAGTNVGVYVGASTMDYALGHTGDPSVGNAYFMTGTSLSIAANRVSYIFDLRGPSMVVDTACSSSMVALDMACRAIRNGQVPMAVVAGVNLLLSPYPYLGFCQAQMLSKEGRCFAFDERADGYVRGEGGGAIILKPLSAALAEGDEIRGVILGTGVNQDGHTVGLSLPNPEAQARLLRSVYGEHGVTPDELSFVEAHGTGTQAGDPIETGALGEALGKRRVKPLPIGSVKTNVGHLEPASGMAGLIKTLLALEHRHLPRSINCATPNPKIDFAGLNLRVAAEAIELPKTGRITAGVNSFGFGGTNAHAILASAPEAAPAKPGDATLPPMLLSARSDGALRALAAEWSSALAGQSSAEAAAALRALATRRDQHPQRIVVDGGAPQEIARRLDAFARGEVADDKPPVLAKGTAAAHDKLAFVFSGNGAQWAGMARDALALNPVFRAAAEEVDALLRPLLGWSPIARLQEDPPQSVEHTEIAQPLLFLIQVGITRVLEAEGVRPSHYFGHSVGEIAAAWAAGALTLPDASKIVFERSRQQERTRGWGRMAALGQSAEDAAKMIARIGKLEIAAINGHAAVTIAGPYSGLQRLKTLAEAVGCYFQLLELDYPFHSEAMDPIRDDLLAALKRIAPRDCGERFISAVTGGTVPGSTLTAEYWWRNIREPVHFSATVDRAIEAGTRIFVEIGPHPILLSYLRNQLRHREVEGRMLGTLTKTPAQNDPFARLAAEIFVAGHDISHAPKFKGPVALRGLPLYPWQRERFWFAPTAERLLVTKPTDDHPLLGFRRGLDDWSWTNLFDAHGPSWLADHAIENQPVLPAAAYVEIAAAAARARFGDAATIEISNLDILRAMAFEADTGRELRVKLDSDGRFDMSSRSRLAGDSWLPHAFGKIAVLDAAPRAPLAALKPKRKIAAADIYALARRFGLNYGPVFQQVAGVEISAANEALVHFRDTAASAGYLLHPAYLDGALQGFLTLLAERGETGQSYLPFRFGNVRLFAPYGRQPATARLTIDHLGRRSARGAIVLADAGGAVIAEIEDCWFRQVQLRRGIDAAQDSFHFIAAASAGNPSNQNIDLGDCIAAGSGGEPSAGADETGLLLEAFLAASAYDALSPAIPNSRNVQNPALLESLCQLLARSGAATPDGSGWKLAERGLPPAADIWRTILAEQPDMVAELALAGAATADLATSLRDGTGRAPAADLLEQFLYASPSAAAAIASLSDAVAAFGESWPAHRPLRVLEIGARGGVLTRRMLRLLTGRVDTLAYVATDADADQVVRLEALAAHHAGVSAYRWQTEPAEEPAFAPGFDLVISAYGLTRCCHSGEALAAVRRVAAGAALLTVEPRPNALWDMVFGLDPNWWMRRGAQAGRSPLNDGEEWRQRLRAAGFRDGIAGDTIPAPWATQLIAARSEPAIAEPAVVEHQGLVIVIAQASNGIASRLARKLEAAGRTVRVIDPPAAADGAELLGALSETKNAAPDVIVLSPRIEQRIAAADRATVRLTNILTVAKLVTSVCERARLTLVTRDGQQTAPVANGPAAAEASIWGLGRVIGNEMPQLDCRMIDFPSALRSDPLVDRLAQEILSPDAEREIVWTQAGRRVLRLRSGLPAREAAGNVVLAARRPGMIDSLEWQAAPERAPGPGEIAVEVAAAGLNFRDVMWTMDLLPEEALMDGFAGPSLGLECAGTVTAIGPQVKGLAVGDRVAGFAPASLSSRVVTAADAVALLPEGMDFAAAASIPVAYLTAVYALGNLGGMQRGETVLIHGGAGGVGIAAIHFAKYRGAKIIATAGSATKRAFLRLLGVDHVLDSRSLAFADEVMALTDGEGVDLVLNSLGGEAMERSLALLRPFGRFLELGKRDFYMNTRVGLRPLRQNISYFAIDADQLPKRRPDLAKSLLRDVMALMQDGTLQPLPRRCFTFADASEAFRLMQASGHIGKIVLVPDAKAKTAGAPSSRRFAVHEDGTYLVTGGLSGFGLATAQWLAKRGARHIALMSRRGIDAPGAGEAIANFAAAGVEARAFAGDIRDAAVTRSVLTQIRATMPPLKGVVHAAMVVDDALLSDLTEQRIGGVLAPKLSGAEILDRETRDDPVDLFLLYSSATTILGAPGQGNYVAANASLEGLARRRNAQGLPALAVAWGPIGDIGFLAEREGARDALARRLAALPMTAKEALDSVPALWESGLDAVALAAVNWSAARRHMQVLASPTFAEFAASGGEIEGGDLRERLEGLTPTEAKELVASLLVEEIGRILLLAADKIDRNRPLSELGMDSLMAVELRLALETRLGISLPLLSLSEGTNIVSLAALVVRSLGGERAQSDQLNTVIKYETADEVVLDATAKNLENVRIE